MEKQHGQGASPACGGGRGCQNTNGCGCRHYNVRYALGKIVILLLVVLLLCLLCSGLLTLYPSSVASRGSDRPQHNYGRRLPEGSKTPAPPMSHGPCKLPKSAMLPGRALRVRYLRAISEDTHTQFRHGTVESRFRHHLHRGCVVQHMSMQAGPKP
jgi:hypothetical protein